jgi:predicted amino acid racemase
MDLYLFYAFIYIFLACIAKISYTEITMKTPFISISLHKIKHNFNLICKICEDAKLQLTPVSKVVMGHPRIAGLYQEKTHSIGDSRTYDILRMKSHGIQGPFMLIRTPALSEANTVVEVAEISMQSDLTILSAINDAAIKLNKRHQVMVMLEMGDLREGILFEQLASFLTQSRKFKGIEPVGIGTNATCFAGLIPTVDNLSFLYEATRIFEDLVQKEALVSGGGSNLIPLILGKKLPSCINHVRIGESIVMGVDAINGAPIPGAYQDCFTLSGEVIELITKASRISGPVAHNAFGESPAFKDAGPRKRALLNIGRLDTDIKQIQPINEGLTILGASSDHLVLDAEEAKRLKIGDLLEFKLNYSSLLFAMNSVYVEKIFLEE